MTPTIEKGPSGLPETSAVVTVCPLNMAATHKEDYGGDFQPMGLFHRRVAPFFPDLKEEDLDLHQVGIQARLVGHQDWVIEFRRPMDDGLTSWAWTALGSRGAWPSPEWCGGC